MAESKKLIKEFERRALSEGTMDANTLATAKKEYVSKLNKFVQMKKEAQVAIAEKVDERKTDVGTQSGEPSTSGGMSAPPTAAATAFMLPAFRPKAKGEIVEDEQLQQMEAGDLIQHGRNVMDETDKSIMRSEAVVEETIQIGTQTAEALRGQTKQLEKIVDDLDEIHFSLKKSFGVLKDITRGLATDKCIMVLLFLVVVGVVVVIVMKFVK
jgi:SNARE protein